MRIINVRQVTSAAGFEADATLHQVGSEASERLDRVAERLRDS